jgi:mannose-1-phosphate guanylyltransferase/phosphomannomutase
MKAVIMAGGEGTRLRPLTSTQPKPMLPMANVPMMEHIVRLLVGHGFEEVVVTVAYLSNSIRTYFGDGSEFGVKISYVSEDSPLGTAGSVGNARDLLSDRFLVISGDVLTDIDLGAALQYHDEKNATVTVVLQRVENPLEFGIVTTDNEGAVTRFLEKPSWGEVFSDTVNTGIYILEPEIFDYIPIKTVSDFSSDVFPRLIKQEERK